MPPKKRLLLAGFIPLLLLAGATPPIWGQTWPPYSPSVTPTPFTTPVLRWTITNVTSETVTWLWGSGTYWKATAGGEVTFHILEIRDGDLHGIFTIGNMTVYANDTTIGSELVLSIWPWFPGLVSHLDWTTVDENATDAVTGWMEGDLEVKTTATTKTYIYRQGPYGNQNTTLIYDAATGILLEGYTEIFFGRDYHLGLRLIQATAAPTMLAVTLAGAVVAVIVVVVAVYFIRRRKG